MTVLGVTEALEAEFNRRLNMLPDLVRGGMNFKHALSRIVIEFMKDNAAVTPRVLCSVETAGQNVSLKVGVQVATRSEGTKRKRKLAPVVDLDDYKAVKRVHERLGVATFPPDDE
jgi:hypothetical protein